MAADSVQSAAGLQVLSGELMVTERTVEQVCLQQLQQLSAPCSKGRLSHAIRQVEVL